MSDLVLARPPRFVSARTMIGRSLRLSSRNVDGLITALALPVMLMLIFVYLFGGAIRTGGQYVDYVVPGVMLVCVGFGAATTAASVADDLTSGIIDRFRSLDVRGESLVGGHVVASVVRNLASTLLVVGVALAIGFRPHSDVVRIAAAVGILALFVLALSWVSALLGILATSAEAATGMTFFITFLPYVSSAFVPIHTMPTWIQPVARNQPVTAVVDSLRALLLGGPAGSPALHAVLWSVGILAVAVPVSGRLFARRTA